MEKYTLTSETPFVGSYVRQNRKNANFLIQHGLRDGDQVKIKARDSETFQQVHHLLVLSLPLLREIGENESQPESIIIAEGDWKDVLNLKSMLYFGRFV